MGRVAREVVSSIHEQVGLLPPGPCRMIFRVRERRDVKGRKKSKAVTKGDAGDIIKAAVKENNASTQGADINNESKNFNTIGVEDCLDIIAAETGGSRGISTPSARESDSLGCNQLMLLDLQNEAAEEMALQEEIAEGCAVVPVGKGHGNGQSVVPPFLPQGKAFSAYYYQLSIQSQNDLANQVINSQIEKVCREELVCETFSELSTSDHEKYREYFSAFNFWSFPIGWTRAHLHQEVGAMLDITFGDDASSFNDRILRCMRKNRHIKRYIEKQQRLVRNGVY